MPIQQLAGSSIQTLDSKSGTTIDKTIPLLLTLRGDFGESTYMGVKLTFFHSTGGLTRKAHIATALIDYGVAVEGGLPVPNSGTLLIDMKDWLGGLHELVSVDAGEKAWEAQVAEGLLGDGVTPLLSFTLTGGQGWPEPGTIYRRLESIE